ncbi:hypothetical protein ZWY2020_031847 [Hordeum vulgare]|nr:hypothetical protein ZWY2020_031847 [Hordeum vulgare]
MEGEGGGVEAGRGRWNPVLLCPLPLSARSKKLQAPTSITSPFLHRPRHVALVERKHDAGCGGVRRARPVVFSLQGWIQPPCHPLHPLSLSFQVWE